MTEALLCCGGFPLLFPALRWDGLWRGWFALEIMEVAAVGGGGPGSGLLGLHLKVKLTGELTLGGALPPGSARPQDAKVSEYRS